MEKKEQNLKNEEILEKDDMETVASNEAAETETVQDQTEDSHDHENEEPLDEKDQIIEKLNAELQSSKDTVLRKVAEFENLKRRSQKERIQLFTDTKVEALEKFLPIRDDLHRTLQASENMEVDPKFLEGIQLVSEKFERVLQEYGVEAIEEENVPFNVDLHDALLRQPAPDDSVPSDTVLKVLETGYKIGDKVIKHAKVIVSQ